MALELKENYSSKHLGCWTKDPSFVNGLCEESKIPLRIAKIPISRRGPTQVNEEIEKNKMTNLVFIPDVTKHFIPIGGKFNTNLPIPLNVRWLIRVLCSMCETNQNNFVYQYIQLESFFLKRNDG